jgi:tetratricopeptide (TPR) repeat protein
MPSADDREERSQRALDVYSRAIELRDDVPLLRRLRARAHERVGATAEAAADLARAEQLDKEAPLRRLNALIDTPGDFGLLRRRARYRLEELADLEGALKDCLLVLQSWDARTDPEAFDLYFEVHAARGTLDGAERDWLHEFGDAQLADFYAARARYLQEHGEPERAAADLDKLNWCREYAQWHDMWVARYGANGREDPWPRLVRARNHWLCGEAQEAEAEISAATTAPRNDWNLWCAVVRLREAWFQDFAAAEASWSQAIDDAQDDPLPWIHRGRWYAERGEHEKANADFAKAASLTPNELNKFLEAGWWVVGPYPAELEQFCPPELDADPSVQVHVVDPQTGLSDEPVKWTHAPSGDFGRIELANFRGGQGNVAVYALAHVYAPAESTATLWASSGKEARIWVNGELVRHITPTAMPMYWSRDPERVPVVLQKGNNTILVKGFANSELTVRLGDHPYDRGMELARHGSWQDAADRLEEGLRRSTAVYEHEYPFRCLAAYRLAAGDVAAVARLFEELSSQPQVSTNSGWTLALAHIGGMAPQIVDDPERLIALVESVPRNEHTGWRVMLPLAYYRAGRFQDVVEFFAGDSQTQDVQAESAPLLAMAQHRLGNGSEAARWLEIGLQKLLHGWPYWIRRHPMFSATNALLMQEASQLITGSSQSVDRELRALFQQRQQDREDSPRETLDFDAAVYLDPTAPFPRIARGNQLARLSRFDEAEADFNAAVELAPNDVMVAASRALYLAERGDVQRAADESERVLRIGFGNVWSTLGFDIESRLATRANVMAELLQRQPDHSLLHRLQGDALAFQGRWEKARQSYTTGTRYWSHEFCAAALSVLLDDGDGYDAAREQVELLMRRELNVDESFVLFHRAWVEALLPAAKSEADERVLALQTTVDANKGEHLRSALGIAQYRAGRYQEAAENLARDSTIASIWHVQPRAWPVLAMAHWRLGKHDTARRYLERTAIYLTLSHRASRQFRTAGGAGVHVHWWLATHALQREARTLIDGPEAAAAELAALTAASNALETPQVTPEQRFESYLMRAVDAAGSDPLPWILRGQWYAQRGEQEHADADFARARELVPNHPLWRLQRESAGRTFIRTWDFSRGTEGWRANEHCRLVAANGIVAIDSTNWDPQILTTAVNGPAGQMELTICARVSGSLKSQLFWRTSGSTWSETNSAKFVMEGDGSEWREYRVPFSAAADVTDLRFDPANRPDSTIHVELGWITLAESPQQAARNRAVALQQEGKFAEAAAAWEGVLETVPDDHTHWMQLAECRMRLGESAAAIAACTRSADVAIATADKAMALLRRGMLRMYLGELPSALEDLNASLALAAADPPAPAVVAIAEQQRCVAWLLLGDIESYRRRCRELLDQHKDSAEVARLAIPVGCCKQHPAAVDDWAEVVEIAERCVQHAPQNVGYGRNLFQVLCRAGRPVEALERVPEVAASNELIPQCLLAMCETQQGNLERARELLAACEARFASERSYFDAERRARLNELQGLIAAAESSPAQPTRKLE